jgi:hypothetical protein
MAYGSRQRYKTSHGHEPAIMKFHTLHYYLLIHQNPSKYYALCCDSNLTVFDELLNNNVIV